MAKKDYTNWDRKELIKEIDQLRKRKKYGLVWEDKPEDVVEQCKKELPVLEEVKDKEIITDPEKPMNLLIEGDNYHALSVLNYTHKGKIDVIYIDPPYNTGNKDFKYNDNYVDKEDSFRHSKWISFMEKRLVLAKNLLKKTGVIFISIDDNEQSQLKLLCDDVFGENNFISKIVIQSNPRGSQASKHLAEVHEYVLVFAKSNNDLIIKGLSKSEENLSEYSNIDKNGQKYRLLGLRQRGGEWKREQRPKMFYPFYVNPKDGTVSLQMTKTHSIETLPKRPTGEEGRWTWSKEKVEASINLLIGKKVNRKGAENFYDIFRFDYLSDENGDESMSKPKTIWLEKELNYQNGRNEIKDIFGKDLFDYPKPTYLIKKIVEMIGNKNSLVLDFFAGSGTTGHAVMQLNDLDGGERKFILCTNNELNGAEKELREQGLSNEKIQEFGICQRITYPRIKSVIMGYKDMDGIHSNLKYFKTAFVPADPTDKNKIALTQKVTEMLCVKEDTFEKVKSSEHFKIFRNKKQYTGIIYDHQMINDFKKEIFKIDGKFSVYVFSLGDDTFDEEFEDMKKKVKLSPIPEAVLRVYRRIFK